MKRVKRRYLRNNEDFSLLQFPRVCMTKPFFRVNRAPEGHSVTVYEDGVGIVTYDIGVDAKVGLRTGSLIVDDVPALFGTIPFIEGDTAHFGRLRELGTFIWGQMYGGSQQAQLLRGLGYLRTTGIVKRVEGAKRAPSFTIIIDWDVGQRDERGDWSTWDPEDLVVGGHEGSWVRFSAEFLRWMPGAIEINAGGFLRMASKLARGMFLYLPSRALSKGRESCEKAEETELTEILVDLGITPPDAPSQRKQLFYRPDRGVDVVKELNGAKLWCGRFFCEMRESTRADDYSIFSWVERDPRFVTGQQELLPLRGSTGFIQQRAPRGEVFKRAFVKGGGTQDDWMSLTRTVVSREHVDRELKELLDAQVFSRVDVERNWNLVALSLKVVGAQAAYRARNEVAKALLEAAVGGKRVENPPGLWNALLQQEFTAAGERCDRQRIPITRKTAPEELSST